MKLGLDFDNTLVTYDRLFHRIASDEGLIPATTAVNKNAVRDALRAQGLEETWIALQGRGYGPLMKGADLFPGVIPALAALHAAGVELCIISHKTKHPYSGEKYDLHAYALEWIQASGLCDPAVTGLRPDNVYFELTKEQKLARIDREECTHFVDDLPEIFTHVAFPPQVSRILFDPTATLEVPRTQRVSQWSELTPDLLKKLTVMA